MTNPTLKIHGTRYILTLEPQRRIITDGSLLVEGQHIKQVGKASISEALPTCLIDAAKMVRACMHLTTVFHRAY